MEERVFQHAVLFGEGLRKRRLAAGLSLTQLSRQVHYSKGQLSKVERGIKAPSPELVRLCDAALSANGELASLMQRKSVSRSAATGITDDNEGWLMQLSSVGQSWIRPMTRRKMLGVGALSLPGAYLAGNLDFRDHASATIPELFRSIFDHYRQIGQLSQPGIVLPALISQAHALDGLAGNTAGRDRQQLLILASRYTEYIGWLVQETGNDDAALWWTRRAADLAEAGGDPRLAAYGLVRHALITLYHDDAERTTQLSQRAQHARVTSRIRGLAALHEAQGHALASDYNASMRALDRASVLLSRPPTDDQPVIGTSNLPDPAEMIRGWCLYDLGRPAAAAEVIGRALAVVPDQALRTRARYGARRALALAVAGDIDHACHLAAELIPGFLQLGSATIAKDLRVLACTLGRHPGNPRAREVAPRLSAALRAIA
jgi:transcriptional regulator with XRE-family HTH domain